MIIKTNSLLNYGPHVLSWPTCPVSHVLLYLRCLLSYVLSCHTCCRALRVSCPACSWIPCFSSLRALMPHLPRTLCVLVLHLFSVISALVTQVRRIFCTLCANITFHALEFPCPRFYLSVHFLLLIFMGQYNKDRTI